MTTLAQTTELNQALDDLEARARRGEEIYEDCVSAGVQATESEETQLWAHARIASILGKRYGDNLIGTYAKAVKRRKRTIYERRQVWDFYPDSARGALLEDTALVYSHLRRAMRLGLKLHNDNKNEALATALDFLSEVISSDWTVDEADRIGGKRAGGGDGNSKVAEFAGRLVSRGTDSVEFQTRGGGIELDMGTWYRLQVFSEGPQS